MSNRRAARQLAVLERCHRATAAVTRGQLDITGRDAPAPPPRYDRDENAERVRLFEPAPTQMPGQTYMDTETRDAPAESRSTDGRI